MAVREIVMYLDDKEALRKKSKPVKELNRQVRELTQDVKDTLERSSGWYTAWRSRCH